MDDRRQPADPRAAIIESLYDVAIEPERYEALLDSWESRIGPIRVAALTLDEPFEDAELESHFERADIFLDRYSEPPDARRRVLDEFPNAAAFTVEPNGKIGGANESARRWFEIDAGDPLTSLPLSADDAEALGAVMMDALAGRQAGSRMLRFRSTRTERTVLFQARVSLGQDPFALVVTSELGWPGTLDATLAEAFSLTPSEIEVVRGLAESRSLKEIAADRNRSVETVRTQIRNILQKTETHSQNELLRVCLAFMDIVTVTEDAGARQSARSVGTASLRPRPFVSMERPDGRRFDHLVIGDENGSPERTLIYLPLDYGLVRWPASAEAEAARRGIRVLVPVRPGYGASTALPWKADRREAVIGDLIALLDRYGIERAPILALGSDGWFAFGLGERHPARVTGLVLAGGGSFPNILPAQFERMEKWHRFIIANGRFAPRVLPFLVKAGFSLARRIGKRGFIHAVYGNCPADVRTFEQAEVYEAMVTGSEVALSDDHSAHDAFSQEIVQQTWDWSASVDACRHLPVISFNGAQDPQAPPDTVNEWEQRFPWVDMRRVEDAGQLIFFARWREVLDELEAMLPEPRRP